MLTYMIVQYSSFVVLNRLTQIDLILSVQLTNDLVKKMESASSDEHIPLMQYMFALAIKIIVTTSFGPFFKDDKEVLKFRKSYDMVSCNHEEL